MQQELLDIIPEVLTHVGAYFREEDGRLFCDLHDGENTRMIFRVVRLMPPAAGVWPPYLVASPQQIHELANELTSRKHQWMLSDNRTMASIHPSHVGAWEIFPYENSGGGYAVGDPTKKTLDGFFPDCWALYLECCN